MPLPVPRTRSSSPAMAFERFSCSLVPITPVHIGSGETLDPFDYFVLWTKDTDSGTLSAIDHVALMQKLAEPIYKETRQKIIMSGNRDDPTIIQELRRQACSQKKIAWTLPLSAAAFKDLEDPNVGGIINYPRPKLPNGKANIVHQGQRQSEIHLMTRQQKPYIPGSSLKGVMRTPIVSAAAQKHPAQKELGNLLNNSLRNRSSADFEAAVLGHSQDSFPSNPSPRANQYADPFRQWAISDLFPDRPDCTKIGKVEMIRQSVQQSRQTTSVLIFREVTGSIFTEDEVNFTGEFRWHHRLSSSKTENGNAVISRSIPIEHLVQSTHAHYLKRLEAEVRQWKTDNGDFILQIGRQMSGLQCLIRIGRHSHFECTTLDEPFRVRPEKGYGKSRSYFEGNIPMGWAMLTLAPMSD